MKIKKTLIFATVVLSILVAVLFFVRHRLHSKYCEDTYRSLPSGDITAVVHEETCDGFGASDVVTVYLEKKIFSVFKSKQIVFKYDPSEFSGPLNISWISHDALKISLDRVQFIEKQTPGPYGISIIYSIGAVGNPNTSHEKAAAAKGT